jgi:hypothetical protein
MRLQLALLDHGLAFPADSNFTISIGPQARVDNRGCSSAVNATHIALFQSQVKNVDVVKMEEIKKARWG